MNWTEGNLARHSRGKQRNALINRQKHHFAKIRHNLLSGRAKQGPAVTTIPFLGSELASGSPDQGRSSRKRSGRSSTPLQPPNRETRRPYPTHLPNSNTSASTTNLDRRKRLLRKSDWAGLRLQRPLDISFPGQVYATKRWARSARSPERVVEEPRDYVTAHRGGSFGHLKRSSMKIHIDGQEIQPSVITGSQWSIRQHTPEPHQSAHRSQQHYLSSETNRQSLSASRRKVPESPDVLSSEKSPAKTTPLSRMETPANVIYSSSVIYEPAPRRNGDFRVLQWSPSNSEDGGSLRVETEQPTIIVAASQESEQRRWKNWMLGEDSLSLTSHSPFKVMETSDNPTEDSESSTLTLPSHLQLQLPSFHLLGEAQPPVQSPPDCDSSENIITKEVVHDLHQDNHVPSNDDSPTLKQRKALDDDLNNMWIKFACGDEDSDDLLMDAFKEAAHQAAVELRPSDTSGSADKCADNAATCETGVPISHQCKEDAISLGASSESHVATQGTSISETGSSTIATVGSTDGPARNTARFVMPKAFVGKNVGKQRAEATRNSIASMPKNGKKGRGKRGKKIATDGRTDIRKLPDFDGDPIEEIEDD